jgi:hypothetical protein
MDLIYSESVTTAEIRNNNEASKKTQEMGAKAIIVIPSLPRNLY